MKKIVFIIITIICIFSIYSSLSSIYNLWTKRDILKSEEEKLVQEQVTNEKIKSELKTANNPFYIESIARNKLFMDKKGESIALMQIPSERDSSKIEAKSSNLERWIALFF